MVQPQEKRTRAAREHEWRNGYCVSSRKEKTEIIRDLGGRGGKKRVSATFYATAPLSALPEGCLGVTSICDKLRKKAEANISLAGKNARALSSRLRGPSPLLLLKMRKNKSNRNNTEEL